MSSLPHQHCDHPKPGQHESDLQFVTSGEPVKKLTIWRNNYVAHRSVRSTLASGELASKYPLTYGEIGKLIDKGLSIMNHYSSHFSASHYIGYQWEDYKSVLKAIKRDFERPEFQA